MSSDQRIEVYRQHRTAQDKYVYFLLAAAGGAIALAVNQTQGAALRIAQMPLACAVFLWGLSFYFGCRHLQHVGEVLRANADLLLVEEGRHPSAGTNLERVAYAQGLLSKSMESNSSSAGRYGRLQCRALIAGACFYIAWHVYEMWLRTP